ncbi:MAG TPA: cupin domain-containing protein [Vicinamibacterales bacterium]|nr:cupin domain-containing protein [Vicinamibacterales bacterium]
MDRRSLLTLFSALAAVAVTTDDAMARSPVQGQLTTAQLSVSRVLHFKDLPVIQLDNGGTQRRVMSGTLPTGEFIEIHETMLPAGKMPHAPHHHPNSEWLFIQSGTLEYDDNGTIVPVGPGDIVFSASNVMHGLNNVGATDATYIVFSVSRQTPE